VTFPGNGRNHQILSLVTTERDGYEKSLRGELNHAGCFRNDGPFAVAENGGANRERDLARWIALFGGMDSKNYF
jgi:hypothetical protein